MTYLKTSYISFCGPLLSFIFLQSAYWTTHYIFFAYCLSVVLELHLMCTRAFVLIIAISSISGSMNNKKLLVELMNIRN